MPSISIVVLADQAIRTNLNSPDLTQRIWPLYGPIHDGQRLWRTFDSCIILDNVGPFGSREDKGLRFEITANNIISDCLNNNGFRFTPVHAQNIIRDLSHNLPAGFILSYLGSYNAVNAFNLQNVDQNEIPVFRIIHIPSYNTDTVFFPFLVANGLKSYFDFSILEDKNVRIKFIQLLDTYRKLRGKETITVSAPQPNTLVPISNNSKDLYLIIGSPTTNESLLNPRKFNTLLPTTKENWKKIQIFDHSKLSREKVFLESSPFAEIAPNTVWLFPQVFTNNISLEERISLLSFCINILIHHSKGTLEQLVRKYTSAKKNASLNLWCQAISRISPGALRSARSQLQHTEDRITDYTKSLQREWTTHEEAMQLITQLDVGAKRIEQQGHEEFMKMTLLPNVKSIEFDGEKANICTEFLHILNPQTEKFHALGMMNFSFSLHTGFISLRVKNLTQTRIGYWNECAHPHIQQDTRGCQGTLGTSLAKLFGLSNYSGAIEQIIFFLQTVNVHDSAGKRITEWSLSDGNYGKQTYKEGELQ